MLNNYEDDEIKTLASLLKAKDDDEDEDRDEDPGLFDAAAPAEEEDAEDEDGEKDMKKGNKFNASYMKKHMKKFMKENPEMCKKYMKDLGYMKKAVEDAYDEIDGIEEADATLVNGTSFFKAFVDSHSKMVDVITSLSERITDLEGQVSYQTELAKASGEVLVKAAMAPMTLTPVQNQEVPPLRSKFMGQTTVMKGAAADKEMKSILLKAAFAGNAEAGRVLSQIEAAGGNMNLLPLESRNVINTLKQGVK